MAIIIDGKSIARTLRLKVAEEAAELQARTGVRPGLAVVLVGEDPASHAYVRTKERMAREAGIAGRVLTLPAQVSNEELHTRVRELAEDPEVHGMLVQLPLPRHLDVDAVLTAIPPEKDVDGFHPLNVGRLWSVRDPLAQDVLVPCTPQGCLILLEEVLGAGGLRGRRALVVGRSNIVGKPMAALLLARDATVTLAHSRTQELAERCREAEVLVAAVGRPEFIRGDWIRPGAVVSDVGINRVGEAERSRLVGDVAFREAAEHASAITPVPGGVGPMTVACLLANTVKAARIQLGLPPAG